MKFKFYNSDNIKVNSFVTVEAESSLLIVDNIFTSIKIS